MIDWISVKDRLPEGQNKYCLVWFEDTKRPYRGWYNPDKKHWTTTRKDFGTTNKVTYWSEINLPEKKQGADINYYKLKAEYDAIKDMYSRACGIIQSVVQEKRLGLGGENIFELAANYIRNETNLAQYGNLQELLRTLGWAGGTIHQVLDVLRKAVAVAQAHKEAEISGDWDAFKAEMCALRYVIGK